MSENLKKSQKENNETSNQALDEKNTKNTFFGIPLSSNYPDKEEQNNSFSFGFGSQNDNNSQNFFVSPTQGNIQFGVSDPYTINNYPSLKSMIYQLELSVQSGKIDENAIGLFKQISQLIPINSISNYSKIIDNATIEKLQQLSTIYNNESKVSESQNSDKKDNKFELTAKDRENLANFYGENRQSSTDINILLDETQKKYQDDRSIACSSIQPSKK
jgi:hypothetical protein